MSKFVLGIPGCIAHSGADPRWFGPPSRERIREIQRRCFYDQYGELGPRGIMYVDGVAIFTPTELFPQELAA